MDNIEAKYPFLRNFSGVDFRFSLYHKLFLTVLTGCLVFLAFPGFNYYLLCWIGYVPLILATRESSYLESYLLGLLAGFIMLVGGFHWIADWGDIVMGIPVPLHYLVIIGYALAVGQLNGLIFLIFRWFQRKDFLHDIFAFPLILVTLFSFFPMLFYYKMGDSQSYFYSALQGTDITGVFGLDFILGLSSISVYYLLFKPFDKRNVICISVACLIVLIWFGYGVTRLASMDETISKWKTKRIGIVQPNRAATLARPMPEKGYSRLYPLEIEMTRELKDKGAEAAFWPEGNFFGYVYWPQVKEAFQKHISQLGIPVLFHDTTLEVIKGKNHYFNSTLYLNEKGIMVDKYNKMIRVPIGEYMPLIGEIEFARELLGDYLSSLSAGKEHKVFDLAGMRMIPLLCYESLFPLFVGEAAQTAPKGGVLLVQSQDGWYGETSASEVHTATTVLRAVENRLPLVHAINNGPSSIILPSGRIHFQTPAFKKGSWAADMPYDETSGGSFYRDHPYWFVNIIRFVFFL
ncbi:MAG: apolipoprotein N-acyltransferase, partial [Deltaproteobacteria bacterium]|nr:apolipoprotein N-acyltransferase [Deltaproteobacteria bacterium]